MLGARRSSIGGYYSEGGFAPLPKPPPRTQCEPQDGPRAGPRASEASRPEVAPAEPARERSWVGNVACKLGVGLGPHTQWRGNGTRGKEREEGGAGVLGRARHLRDPTLAHRDLPLRGRGLLRRPRAGRGADPDPRQGPPDGRRQRPHRGPPG